MVFSSFHKVKRTIYTNRAFRRSAKAILIFAQRQAIQHSFIRSIALRILDMHPDLKVILIKILRQPGDNLHEGPNFELSEDELKILQLLQYRMTVHD